MRCAEPALAAAVIGAAAGRVHWRSLTYASLRASCPAAWAAARARSAAAWSVIQSLLSARIPEIVLFDPLRVLHGPHSIARLVM